MRTWSITWGDGDAEKTWTAADLTVAHSAAIAELRLKDDWDFDPTTGPIRLTFMLAAFIAVDTERSALNVLAELYPLPLATIVAALDVDE